MALSFGDIALSIGAGVAEKDMAIRDAEFKQSLENFKEEKAHVKKLAELRYARDLKTYDDEVAKLDRVKSIYSLAAKADPLEAGKLIASAEYEGYKDLSEEGKNSLGASIAANFKYNYKTYKEGDKLPEGAKVGDRVMVNGQPVIESFSFGRKDYTLTEPKPSSYYMDSKFWKDEEEKLDKSSFVTKQLRKLLNKKEKTIDNIDYVEMIQNKKVNEVKTLLDDEEPYTSTNLGTASVQGAKLYRVKESEKKVYERIIKEYDESTGITTNNILKAVINPIIQLNKKVSDNYTLDQVKGELQVSGDGQHIGFVSNQLWNHINLAKRNSIEYYGVPDASGNSNVGEFRAWDMSKITNEYQSKWRERHLKLSNETLIPFDAETASLSGITLIPLEILPVQINLSEEQREFIESNVNIVIKGTKGNIADNKTLIYGSITDSLIKLGFKEVLNTTAYATNDTGSTGVASYDAKNNTIIVNEKVGNVDVGVYPVDGIKKFIADGVELPESIISLIPSDDDKYKNLQKKEESNESNLPFEPNKIFTQ
jgi:hypothetical protein